jgi:V8-like Glu-specific endopeptidase
MAFISDGKKSRTRGCRECVRWAVVVCVATYCWGSAAAQDAEVNSVAVQVVTSDLPWLSEVATLQDVCTPSGISVVQDQGGREVRHNSQEPKWLRVHLILTSDLPGSSWKVDVVGHSGSVADTINAEELRSAGAEGIWSRPIPEMAFSIRVRSDQSLNGLGLCADKYSYQQLGIEGKFVIHNHDDRKDLVQTYGTRHRYYKYGIPIAIVFFQDIASGKDTNCTGFLLAATILITNNHCISDRKQLRNASAVFFYETGGKPIQVQITEILAQSPQDKLDYTVLRLAQNSGPAVSYSSTGLPESSQDGQPLRFILIQHPNNRLKLIAVKKCSLQSRTVAGRGSDFFHLCDSSEGSSGSPVMVEATGVVVGLHHMGATDPSAKNDYHNMAVSIAAILGDISSQNKQAYDEIKGSSQGAK